jgi:hypothetical protein
VLEALQQQAAAAADLAEEIRDGLADAHGVEPNRATQAGVELARAVQALQRVLTRRCWWRRADPPQK